MKKQAIVVLSGGITEKGKLPFFVKNRLNEAYKLYYQHTASRIVVSGKWSHLYEEHPDITEAQAMQAYLVSLGVPEEHIIQESKSQDLISSAYYVRKNVLAPRHWREVIVIGSDFQEERVSYVFNKIFGKDYSISYRFVHSQLQPEVLWTFFRYENSAYAASKEFLKKINKNTVDSLKDAFFTAQFYKAPVPSNSKVLVREGKTGKPRKAKLHYPLKSIYKKRLEIFERYQFSGKHKKTFKADFWFGRFLNFFAQDPEGVLYCLKFVLYVKDKKTFVNEINLTEYLRKQGIDFIPPLLDKDIEHAPPWYVYKVVAGKMSGRFSITYSFDEHFYKEFTPRIFVQHLKKLRSVDIKGYELPIWDANKYKSKIKNELTKRIENYKDLSSLKILQDALKYLSKNVDILNTVKAYPSHNDLHPANIIVSSLKKIYLIDFERVALNNIASDFCFAYIFSWNNPSFQERLLETFRKSLSDEELEEFENIFDYIYLYFLLWFIPFTSLWMNKSGKENSKLARSYALNEIKRLLKKNT